ncbi:MAG: DUF302 domain-containing protein [Candidatus Marinimicrobia bacterium]|nr:DUF302 domain-containing protein [Candidatus Neomarinimicrobiota bacterium]
MNYYFNKDVDYSFDTAIEKVSDALGKEGFGILTQIDVKETLKKKLDVDFYRYQILGACNPAFAYKALQTEDKIGTMLPCNIIVQEKGEGKVEVSAVDPLASMQAIENPDLKVIAEEVRDKLKLVIDRL